MFRTVFIPPTVADELAATSPGIHSLDITSMPYLQVRKPSDAELVRQLGLRVHPGEAEALALAVEIRPEVVLIDEKVGRNVAKQLGLVPLGVLGLLVKANRVGFIGSVAPLVAILKRELDFRISATVERRILNLADE